MHTDLPAAAWTSREFTHEPGPSSGWAQFDGVRARGVLECIDLATDAGRLDEGGTWFVVAEFSGSARAWRFAEVDWFGEAEPRGTSGDWATPHDYPHAGWMGPPRSAWTSSCSQADYMAGVERIRSLIRAGDVFQVNLCRVLTAPLPIEPTGEPDAYALAQILADGNPAPYAGLIHVSAAPGIDPIWVVSASPELFLDREGTQVRSGPIKGTAPTTGELLEKDYAENVMITDLVRNDLATVCESGSVVVERLHDVEEHPGLVHLVSTVAGRLRQAHPSARGETEARDTGGGVVGWREIFAGTFPPGSVAGAPKTAACEVITNLEPADRGPYCGAIGWIDADRARARLAVGIRTFWWAEGQLHFGTGAGITWGSDPLTEWQETELKARRLVGLASPSEEESA